jgi:Fe-S cluster biogenesis protein NfuA
MPKIADLEYTPNPNARKFVLKEALTHGLARSFENTEQAQRDELAAKLFAIPHVTNVFYVDNWITVTQDGDADWQNLLREVATPIREAPAAEKASEEFAKAAAWLAEDEGGGATLSESDKLKLEQINELLDEEVRPFLQGDGGDLYVVGIEGNTLKIHYQGACGTCPSSISGTLAGIEGLVRRIDPEMEVVAV